MMLFGNAIFIFHSLLSLYFKKDAPTFWNKTGALVGLTITEAFNDKAVLNFKDIESPEGFFFVRFIPGICPTNNGTVFGVNDFFNVKRGFRCESDTLPDAQASFPALVFCAVRSRIRVEHNAILGDDTDQQAGVMLLKCLDIPFGDGLGLFRGNGTRYLRTGHGELPCNMVMEYAEAESVSLSKEKRTVSH
jgi:hypothetical protein